MTSHPNFLILQKQEVETVGVRLGVAERILRQNTTGTFGHQQGLSELLHRVLLLLILLGTSPLSVSFSPGQGWGVSLDPQRASKAGVQDREPQRLGASPSHP